MNEEYRKWFKEKFGNFPDDTTLGIKEIDTLVGMREDCELYGIVIPEIVKIATEEEWEKEIRQKH